MDFARAVKIAGGGAEAKKKDTLCVSFFLVTRRGFEPRTHCLKGSCSAD